MVCMQWLTSCRASLPAEQGQKFVVAERPQRTGPRGYVPLTPEEAAAEKARRAAAAASADTDAAALPALFE